MYYVTCWPFTLLMLLINTLTFRFLQIENEWMMENLVCFSKKIINATTLTFYFPIQGGWNCLNDQAIEYHLYLYVLILFWWYPGGIICIWRRVNTSTVLEQPWLQLFCNGCQLSGLVPCPFFLSLIDLLPENVYLLYFVVRLILCVSLPFLFLPLASKITNERRLLVDYKYVSFSYFIIFLLKWEKHWINDL